MKAILVNVIVNNKFWSLFCETSLENIECFQVTLIFLWENIQNDHMCTPTRKTKALTTVILFSKLAILYKEHIRGNF